MERRNSQNQEDRMEVDQSNSHQAQEQDQAPTIKLKDEAMNDQDQNQNSVPIVKKSEADIKKHEEKKSQLKEQVVRLISQIKKGCNKDICPNQYCSKNKLRRDKLIFQNDKEILQFCLKCLNNVDDKESLLCSDASSLNSQNISTTNEKQLFETLEDVFAFCSSFSISNSEGNKSSSSKNLNFQSESELHQSSILLHQNITKKAVFIYAIDQDSLGVYYNCLKKSTNDENLRKAIEALLSVINSQIQLTISNEDELLFIWRGQVMLLSNELLEEWDWRGVFISLLSSIVELTKKNKPEQLIEFLALTINKEKFLQLVQRIQSFVTLSIMSGVFEHKSIENALRVLDLFNLANEIRILKHKIDYKEFYNDAINKEVHLKDHIVRWIQDKEIAKNQRKVFDKKAFNLCNFPWILDSANKYEILKYCNKFVQKNEVNNSLHSMNIMQMLQTGDLGFHIILKVNRSNILTDTLQYISNSQINLRKPLKVQFIGEPGVDEGGVRKEFFQLLIKELFNPNFGMFNYNQEQGKCWFNGLSHEMNIYFELVGVLMGLAVFNQILIDMPFPSACYKKLLDQPITYDDLREWQPEIAKALDFIIDYNDEKPLEEVLGTNFTIDVTQFEEQITIELKPGGTEILVSKENRDEYIELYIDYIFNKQCEDKFKSFRKGFYRVCDEENLAFIFKHEELELCVCGIPDLDFSEWKKAVRYVDGYDESYQIIGWFWEVLLDMTEEQKQKFLTFTTGCNRAPILGLSTLPLYIGREGPDSDRLPSAHTCFNHLLIPEYSSKEKLREKILIAINNSEGFGLI